MEYHNMDIELFGYAKRYGVERFKVRVGASPKARQKINQAIPTHVPKNLRNRLCALEHRSLSATEIQAVGESIGQMLFPETLQNAVAAALDQIGDEEGLRIRLTLDDFALADLPWEYAFLQNPAPAGFLVLNRRISLVRYEVIEGRLPSFARGEDSLRLAALLADPKRSVEYRELGLAAEEAKIRDALSRVDGLTPKFYADAKADDLTKALDDRPHIFHFSGHGKFMKTEAADSGSYEGQGFLVFLDETLGAREFEVSKLVRNLEGCGVRLAVLGACETARRDGQNAWTGIAPSLTRINIPAVIGMQYGIRNTNATTFSEHFYHALAQGESIDWAMSTGRLAIYTNSPSTDERDWGVPVLYLRMSDTDTSTVLFPRLSRTRDNVLPQRDVSISSYIPPATFPCSNPHCTAQVRPGLRYCEQCAQELKYCSRCKSIVSLNARFCGYCGVPIPAA